MVGVGESFRRREDSRSIMGSRTLDRTSEQQYVKDEEELKQGFGSMKIAWKEKNR